MTAGAFAGLASCVHCGFCLPACPTYEVTADESDSPRGRIVLMRALARGEMAARDDALQFHLDRCLGCRACESVCPSGVVYGPALEAARAAIGQVRSLPSAVAVGLWILARPERQRLLWVAARALRRTGIPEAIVRAAGLDAPRFASLLAMLAATAPAHRRTDARTHRRTDARTHGRTDAQTRRRGGDGSEQPGPLGAWASGRLSDAVALFRGCVMDGLFRHVHDATIRTLAVNGVRTREVPGQLCCGALAAHAGAEEMARALARANVEAFDHAAPGVPVVTNSAGCGAMLKSYGEWLRSDALERRAQDFATRVRDVTEVLAERGPERASSLHLRVAYDEPCHLLHAQKIATAPRAVLEAIPGLDVVPLEGADRCCGSAGLYSLVEPELSREVLAAKLRAIREAAPDVVVTGNPGCQMQIGSGALLAEVPVEVRHPVELLDRAYRG